MVLAAAAKALRSAEAIKEKVLVIKGLLTDNNIWVLQQQLMNTYRSVLILDLEYALDKKVEQDLWNHAFKNFIANLQIIAKDKKNPKRPEAQAMLHWCLEAAAGFYLCLLQEVCSAFELDLPFRRQGSLLGCTASPSTAFSKDCFPSKNSCFYICQHCLVHLGDIARYRNQNRQAETFYRYALMLSPTSGQPYNQLGILEASRGDKVSAVFYHVRALALSHPFPAAATNLMRAFNKHAEDVIKVEGHSKLSSHEYLAAFLKLHGLLSTHSELDKAEKLVQMLTTSLTAHIATEALSGWKLVQIVAINIFTLKRVKGEDVQQNDEMTGTERRVISLVSHFLAGCLNAFLLPVYTIKDEEPLLEYFAMPAIKLTLEWIQLAPAVLQSAAFTSRRQIWPSLCRLLKQCQSVVKDFPANKYKHVPLPEDRDLQGFLPFEKIFQNLKFSTEDLKTDPTSLNKLRAARLLQFGQWLGQQTPPLITISPDEADPSEMTYEPVGRPEPPADLLRELEELTLGKTLSPEPLGSLTGSSTPDSNGFLATCIGPSQESLPEKRGILKSDVPLEKLNEAKTTTGRAKRNVALAAIMNQKVVDDVKQVTFKTPSPTKDKSPKPSPKKPTATKQSRTTGNDSKSSKTTVNTKPTEAKSENLALVQQQKLMEVLEKHGDKKKTMDDKRKDETGRIEQTQQKQQLLSALFDDKVRADTQHQAMSGLLNLNKQQQEMLSNSKTAPRQPPGMRNVPPQQNQPPRLQSNTRLTSLPGPQRVVEKMEAARKEYEDAMFVLQQRKQQQRYPGENEQLRVLPPSNATPMSHVFVPMPQPMMGLPPMQPVQYPYNHLQQGMMVPWQEPEQPPMPPASWWTDRLPSAPNLMPSCEPPGYRPPQPLSTYSLFSNPMGGDAPSLHVTGRVINQQSFWSGPGPSPLERLLEQQRQQLRDSDQNT